MTLDLKKTFTGHLGYRAQLCVLDLTGPDVPASIRKEKPSFEVRVLRKHYDQSTAFSVGKQVYYGDDIHKAIDAIVKYVGFISYADLPKKLRSIAQ